MSLFIQAAASLSSLIFCLFLPSLLLSSLAFAPRYPLYLAVSYKFTQGLPSLVFESGCEECHIK